MAAPPALSVREQIILSLLETLADITTLGGYATDLVTITRGILSPLETFALPLASVILVDDRPEIGAQVYRRTLTCMIRVWIDDTPAESGAHLEGLLADISQALQVDTSRGGYAEYSLEGQTQYLYNASTERLAGADMTVNIDYKVPISTPREVA